MGKRCSRFAALRHYFGEVRHEWLRINRRYWNAWHRHDPRPSPSFTSSVLGLYLAGGGGQGWVDSGVGGASGGVGPSCLSFAKGRFGALSEIGRGMGAGTSGRRVTLVQVGAQVGQGKGLWNEG